MWSMLAREVYENGRQYNKNEELKEVIVAAWRNLAQDKIHWWYASFPRQIMDKNGQALIKFSKRMWFS